MDKAACISLDGDWKMAVLHHPEVKNLSSIPTDLSGLAAAGHVIDAIVPGNFELDLERSGMIEDPFYADNPRKMQAYEDAHVFYTRTFSYDPLPGTEPVLVFEGIDTIGDIYLNGRLLGHAENMFIHHHFEADGIVPGENELLVHLTPVCIEARANRIGAGNTALKYNYESLRVRKAPHMFGWDIMPRLVSAGLFRPVRLWHRPAHRIRQAYLMTRSVDSTHNTAKIELFYDLEMDDDPLDGCCIRVEGHCGESAFSAGDRLWFVNGKLRIDLPDVRLWWPRGYGDADLYDVRVTLEKDGCIIDSLTFRTGIRTVALVRTSLNDTLRGGDFHFEINGRQVFPMGTNWLPVDAYHSRDRQRIPRIMEMVEDLRCNIIRCWGGNLYEDDLFYESCDEQGVMVWQDFAMACGVYPFDEEFREVMRVEAVAVVRRLRQHPCLILWSGDNECDWIVYSESCGRNPNRNGITREVLPDVIHCEDPVRPFMPSSPYYDEVAWTQPDEFLPEHHLWGPRDYFKGPYYQNVLNLFTSELGYHGCPAVESIKKFISPQALWPWRDNEEWILHSASPEAEGRGPFEYRIELMAKHVRELFGFIPDDPEQFSQASQISQAEANKFFIEKFRSEQPKRKGIIWWNLIDGWPQFSDAVVDYYFTKKLSYHYIKISQSPLILTFTEPRNWNLTLVAVNNAGRAVDFDYRVTDYDGDVVAEGRSSCADQSVLELIKLPYTLSTAKLYVIDWKAEEFSGRNHYLAGNPPFDLNWYQGFLKDIYGDFA